MSSSANRLTPLRVLETLKPLLRHTPPLPSPAPACRWCQGPTVWTSGNKTRCTRCGYVPS